MTTTIGELCMGYGGLGIGLSLALGGDTRVAWAVEYDKHPSAIIAHRYPGIPNYGDVNDTDWTQVEPVDWLTAGYPCQPFSHAGLRKGADDPRHLWPGAARAVSVLRPRNVLLENVAGHVSLGLDTVLGDLAALGYDASWGVVRAAEAGAPHGRARVFIVATDTESDQGRQRDRNGVPVGVGRADKRTVAADASGERHGRGQDARGLGRVDGSDADQARERKRTRTEPGDRGAEAATDASRGSLAGAGATRDGLRLAAERSAEPAADATGVGRREGRAEPSRLVGRPNAAVGGVPVAADAYGQGGTRLRSGTAQAHTGLVVGGRAGVAADAVRSGRQGLDGQSSDPHAPQPAADRPTEWGAYAPAIARWERVLGRPAPRPTEAGRTGERLSPRFVEWMQGLPAGWVTDVPRLPRNAQLKALGNGVVPQQAALAVRMLWASVQEYAA